MKATLQLGSLYFVPSTRALIDTLFQPINGRTAAGTYKRLKGCVLFSRPNGTPFAALIINQHGERFFVTASRHEDGKLYYMHGLSDVDKAALGLADLGYRAMSEKAHEVAALLAA